MLLDLVALADQAPGTTRVLGHPPPGPWQSLRRRGRPTRCPNADGSASASAPSSRAGGWSSSKASRLERVTRTEEGIVATSGGQTLPGRGRGRGGHGLPSGSRHAARATPGDRSDRRVPNGAGLRHRPQCPLLWHGAAARRGRTAPARARLLLGGHEELRSRAELPHAHGLRAGALHRLRAGGRRRGRSHRRADPAGDGRVWHAGGQLGERTGCRARDRLHRAAAGPAPAHIDACCVLDAEAKAAGQDGCGCGSNAAGTSASVLAVGCAPPKAETATSPCAQPVEAPLIQLGSPRGTRDAGRCCG